MSITSLLSSMSVPVPCAATQFPIIRGHATHPRHRAGLILPSPSSLSISTSSQPPHRDTRCLRPTSPVLSSSRKASKIGRRVGLVGGYGGLYTGFGSIGSCGGYAVIATDGGCDGVPPSCGGGGGGGRGGEEESSNAGGGDRDLPLLVRVLAKLKKLEKDPHLGRNMAFKSFRVLADYIERVLHLLISTPEGSAVLSFVGVVVEHGQIGHFTTLPGGESTAMVNKGKELHIDDIGEINKIAMANKGLRKIAMANKDNSQCLSPCDSSSSMSTENLQCPSSFDPASSRIDTMSPMRVEGRHSGDNCDVEGRSRSLWGRLIQFANRLPSYRGSRTAPVVSPVTNPAVNRKKGLLGSFYTIAEKLFIFCGGLVIWSLQYPLGANARQSFDDHGMQGIIIASFISFFLSCILAPLASYTKEAESVYGAGMEIFKWLFLAQSLGLCAELCAILRFCAHTPLSIMWSLGIVGSVSIVLIWAWVFYVEVRQEQMGSLREESRMLLAKPESETASTTLRLPPV